MPFPGASSASFPKLCREVDEDREEHFPPRATDLTIYRLDVWIALVHLVVSGDGKHAHLFASAQMLCSSERRPITLDLYLIKSTCFEVHAKQVTQLTTSATAVSRLPGTHILAPQTARYADWSLKTSYSSALVRELHLGIYARTLVAGCTQLCPRRIIL